MKMLSDQPDYQQLYSDVQSICRKLCRAGGRMDKNTYVTDRLEQGQKHKQINITGGEIKVCADCNYIGTHKAVYPTKACSVDR